MEDKEEDVYIYRRSQHTTPPHGVPWSVVEAPRHGALAERGVQVKKHDFFDFFVSASE